MNYWATEAIWRQWKVGKEGGERPFLSLFSLFSLGFPAREIDGVTSSRRRWPYGFVLGLGYFGIVAMGPVYNTYVPLLLRDLGLTAGWVGFVMGWDNWLNMFIPAWVGARSDVSWTRFGRRKPWIMAGAPFAIFFFTLIPEMRTLAGLLAALFITSLCSSIIRAPGLALLGDLFDPAQRSKANGVINLVGGLGVLVALAGSGYVYSLGAAMPFRLGSVMLLASTVVFLVFVSERKAWGSVSGAGVSSVWQRLGGMIRGRERQTALILLAAFFSFSGFSILETWVSSYGRYALGLDPDRLPFLLAIFAVSLLVGAIPAGFFGARVGYRQAMGIGIAALMVIFAAGVVVQTQLMLMILLVPAGVAWSLIIINLFPLLYQAGGDSSIGLMTGLYYTVTSLASVAGPWLAGLLLDWSGQDYRWVWALAAGFMAAGVVSLRSD